MLAIYKKIYKPKKSYIEKVFLFNYFDKFVSNYKLSRRESQFLYLMIACETKDMVEIASILGIARGRLKNHYYQVLKKLKVKNYVSCVTLFFEFCLIFEEYKKRKMREDVKKSLDDVKRLLCKDYFKSVHLKKK